MSVTQITYRRVFNAYLVAEDDGLTLIDTGPASARGAVRAAVTAQGGRLRRIVLTHAHADHVAGIDGLVIEHPDVEIIVGWREAALLAGNLSLRAGEPGPPPKRRSFKTPASKPSGFVTDGGRFPRSPPGTPMSRWPAPAACSTPRRDAWPRVMARSSSTPPAHSAPPSPPSEPLSRSPLPQPQETTVPLIRKLALTLLIPAGIAALAGGGDVAAAAGKPPVVAGGCRVKAHAFVSGLTFVAKPFSYHYTGRLTGCAYTRKGAPIAGTITAGEPIKIGGKTYQEPIPSGTGTCLSTNTTGYDFARWADGTQTIVKFETSGGGGTGTHLYGEIVPSLPLKAVDGSGTTVFKSNRFLGQVAVGKLLFKAKNAAQCASDPGLQEADISGLLGHVGDKP